MEIAFIILHPKPPQERKSSEMFFSFLFTPHCTWRAILSFASLVLRKRTLLLFEEGGWKGTRKNQILFRFDITHWKESKDVLYQVLKTSLVFPSLYSHAALSLSPLFLEKCSLLYINLFRFWALLLFPPLSPTHFYCGRKEGKRRGKKERRKENHCGRTNISNPRTKQQTIWSILWHFQR